MRSKEEEGTIYSRLEIISCLQDISDASKAEKALEDVEEERIIFLCIEGLDLIGAFGEDLDHHLTRGTITREELRKLRYLEAQFEYLEKKHGDYTHVGKWLRDPRYAEVVRAAKRALDVFRATPGEPPFNDR